MALGALEREAWPTVAFNTIEVSVAYSGAVPDEVEKSIIVEIEERVEALQGVKAVALFPEIRLAIWVVAGLITPGIGALAVVLVLDLAINTISLFAFVPAIGIIVDDAIVVAEYIHYERKRGLPGVAAAIRGTRRIKNALIFAVLTLVAAFTPLLFIPGGIGEIWAALPIIIIGMLLISLSESLLNRLYRLEDPGGLRCEAGDHRWRQVAFPPHQSDLGTTFPGFTPLILERAIQAQFPVLFAASLGVGVMIKTAIPMLLIRALMAIYPSANSGRGAATAS
ncbi:MAG: efflux RND transporter permease subunit [Acidobacteriota bacterium]|nr:efflux RND transporter permease subunit [Acidobacteriota bacterium]